MGSLINVDFTNRTVKSASSSTSSTPPAKAAAPHLQLEDQRDKRCATVLVCELIEILEAMPPWLPVYVSGTDAYNHPIIRRDISFEEIGNNVGVVL